MKTSRFLVPVLLVVIVFLTGVTLYQGRVIRNQSFELRWLMGHCKQ